MEARISAIKETLNRTRERQPDALLIIGSVSGLGEEKLRKIADGEYTPTYSELVTLEALAAG
jgi:hypothetical protein